MPADLQQMAVAARPPGDYAPVAGARAVESLRAAADPLRGTRVLHLSVAGAHGQVPELLAAVLPLAAGAGVDVSWQVLFGAPELREVANGLDAGLRGAEAAIDEAAWHAYRDACERAGRALAGHCDLIVLHDPGALGLAAGLEGPVVWHCHVDASRADQEALARTADLIKRCDLVLVPDGTFAPDGFGGAVVRAAPPGIDPLDPRNLELESRLPGRIVRSLGVDLDRPFCLQVLTLDRWDDPHAAIEAFRLVKEDVPRLQLVLAGLLDPAANEDWQAAKEVSDYAADTPDLLLLTSYEGLGSLELGALQLLARAALERSLSEGFHLAPCEALWKRTPVVGGKGGGLPLMVRDGVDGYLTDDGEAFAAHIAELVRDPGLAAEMGRAGRERVRERFLVTAALERELRALAGVATL
jgi:trehalose synthase